MADTVNLFGVRADGSTELLGTAPMPPRMKAREIASDHFGPFKEDDCSNADTCFWALVGFLDWLETQGWRPPTLIPVWSEQPPATGKEPK